MICLFSGAFATAGSSAALRAADRVASSANESSRFVGKTREQQREQHGGAERSTDLAEERRRARRDTHVAQADRVLAGDRQRLHQLAEAEADQQHGAGDEPVRRVVLEEGQVEEAAGEEAPCRGSGTCGTGRCGR